jgi:hypothetical protein
MLCQVSIPDIINRDMNGAQEVPFPHDCTNSKAFAIHCRHDTIRIYYAHLPNVYLRRILDHGAEQGKHLNDYPGRCNRVSLRRTRPYRGRFPKELSLLFEEVASLILHLSSGKARTGYLFNYPENPLHTFVGSPASSR